MEISPSTPNPALLCDLANDLLAEESASRQAKISGLAAGPITGIKTLDKEIGGFLAKGIHVFLASPGAGKTAFALQVAANCGCPALYITSEMLRIELLRRIVARETNTFLARLRGGELDDEELIRLLRATAFACPKLALYDATSGATCQSIHQKALALRERFNAPHVLIIIDSVTDWAFQATQSEVAGAPAANLTEFQMAEGALNGLKALAADLQCPIIAIAHRSRVGQKAQGADKLHAAKATGRYEYIAESVWDLQRDVMDKPDRDGTTKAEFTLLKNRHGRTGASLFLKFEGRVQRFFESEHGGFS